jgi:hypothetical protein
MPIVEPAPWRHQYFAHVRCRNDIFIPADDPEAWAWNPQYAWVFDKLRLALSQGLKAAPHGLTPTEFPVFSKPIFNFGGMGAGSRILADAADYAAGATAGHMWMPVLTGDHISTDAAIVDGKVAWTRHATGRPTHGGTFDYWTIHAAGNEIVETKLEAWINANLGGYTGMLNAETIGGTIIDAHLRFADQWPDLYGPKWVEALVTLYEDKVWAFADKDRKDAFSVALFLPHGQHYRSPPKQLVSDVLEMPAISSVQITFHEDRPPHLHSMPPGGFRVAVINAWGLDEGRRARERLANWFRSHHGWAT